MATIVSLKVSRVTSHHLYYCMCSKCSSEAWIQAANINTTCQQQAQ